MTIYYSRELWGKKKIQKEVYREKGKFVKHRNLKKRPDFKPVKKEIKESVNVDVKDIQITNKYLIYKSDKIESKRGQVITKWKFRWGVYVKEVTGGSYISNNVKRDFKKLSKQSYKHAVGKTELGYPDKEILIEIFVKYIIRIRK